MNGAHGMKRHWIAVFAVVVIAGIFGCGKPSPGETVKKFYLAVQDRRYDEAIEKYTTKSFGEMLNAKDPLIGVSGKARLFHSWDNGFRNLPRIKKFVVKDEHVDGNRATVKLEIHYENGKLEKVENNLVWEDSGWKIIFPTDD